MKTYAIFMNDCEIHIHLKVGTLESIDTIREELNWLLKDDPQLESGYVEQYPFYQADWEVVGYSIPKGFNQSTVLEVTT
jgi:hypothetical protein